MQHSVENLMQVKQSILQQTETPRNGALNISFTPKEYNFEEFLQLMEMLKPRYFRIATRKEGINIIFGITRKKAFFGRAENFSGAFRKLFSNMELAA